MTDEQDLALIRKIKKTHENLVVYGGIGIAFILLIYFFTFPQLIDHSATGLLWVQGISTILFALILVYLKKITYVITKLLLGRNVSCKQMMAVFSPTDLLKADEQLLAQLKER